MSIIPNLAGLPATLTPPRPDNGDVDVWRFDFPQAAEVTGSMWKLLSNQELERARRFIFSEDQAQYIVMHGALRALLGNLLGSDARKIRFAVNENGKPFMEGFASFQFNISHTKGMGLLAISPSDGSETAGRADVNGSVGIDAEFIRPDFPYEEIVARYFPGEETSEILSMPLGEQHRAFYLSWVRKEAWVKAVGIGLDQLPDLDVDLRLSLTAGLSVLAEGGKNGIAPAWLRDLDVGHSHAATLAVCGAPSIIRCVTWQPNACYA